MKLKCCNIGTLFEHSCITGLLLSIACSFIFLTPFRDTTHSMEILGAAQLPQFPHASCYFVTTVVVVLRLPDQPSLAHCFQSHQPLLHDGCRACHLTRVTVCMYSARLMTRLANIFCWAVYFHIFIQWAGNNIISLPSVLALQRETCH